MIAALRDENFDRVMKAFDAIRLSTPPKNRAISLYTTAISICNKAQHLERALEISKEMESLFAKTAPLEAIQLPIIRCYCDKGDIGDTSSVPVLASSLH
jgi:pentatricopeptide repeat protein